MTHEQRMEVTAAVARIVFSVFLIAIGFYCIHNVDQTLQKVGIGFIGTVAGYWLR